MTTEHLPYAKVTSVECGRLSRSDEQNRDNQLANTLQQAKEKRRYKACLEPPLKDRPSTNHDVPANQQWTGKQATPAGTHKNESQLTTTSNRPLRECSPC